MSFPGPGTLLPDPPVQGGGPRICALWYGLGPEGLWTGGLEVSLSTEILIPLPGTTSTMVGGAVSLLDDKSSDEEDLPPLLASLGVPDTPLCFVASWGSCLRSRTSLFVLSPLFLHSPAPLPGLVQRGVQPPLSSPTPCILPSLLALALPRCQVEPGIFLGSQHS